MNSTSQTIGDIVAADYRTADIFRKYKIDFCCNGNRTIDEACNKAGIAADQLKQELQEILQAAPVNSIDYKSWPLDLLVDYIEKKHHRYAATQIPAILGYLTKIAAAHGNAHPELYELKELFASCAEDLTAHMKKEEAILFPIIRSRVEQGENTDAQEGWIGTIHLPVRMMMHEHDTEGERFRKIAALSNNYQPPADGCNTYKVAYNLLKDFESDLHTHIHLENNILFPRAIEMEN